MHQQSSTNHDEDLHTPLNQMPGLAEASFDSSPMKKRQQMLFMAPEH